MKRSRSWVFEKMSDSQRQVEQMKHVTHLTHSHQVGMSKSWIMVHPDVQTALEKSLQYDTRHEKNKHVNQKTERRVPLYNLKKRNVLQTNHLLMFNWETYNFYIFAEAPALNSKFTILQHQKWLFKSESERFCCSARGNDSFDDTKNEKKVTNLR